MKQLKQITEKLVIYFVEQGHTAKEATDIVLELLKEYTPELQNKKFNQVAKELEFTFLR